MPPGNLTIQMGSEAKEKARAAKYKARNMPAHRLARFWDALALAHAKFKKLTSKQQKDQGDFKITEVGHLGPKANAGFSAALLNAQQCYQALTAKQKAELGNVKLDDKPKAEPKDKDAGK